MQLAGTLDLTKQFIAAKRKVELSRCFHVNEIDVKARIHETLSQIEFEIQRGVARFRIETIAQPTFQPSLPDIRES